MNSKDPIVIVGAGHAGVQAAASLRDEGHDGKIVLLGDEKHAPYQRPPLSKTFIKGEISEESLMLRGPSFYAQKHIDLVLGETVGEIDRAASTVRMHSGRRLAYSHLVLAVGGKSRPLSIPGAELDGVVGLRTLADAEVLRTRIAHAQDVAVVGAGFIGLEFAAVAASMGCRVRIVELAPHVMARAVSAPVSQFYEAAHRAFGSELVLGATVSAFAGADGKVEAVRLADGRTLPASLVLVGIGILPRDDLAAASGLVCRNGIVVDQSMLTSDPNISAIGDVACHPNIFAHGNVRIESVQNANDQARNFAKRIAGKAEPYKNIPWFWSDQGNLKLQMAGMLCKSDAFVVRGNPANGKFSVFCFEQGRLSQVESVNQAADHMAARRLIANGTAISPEQAADLSVDLKALCLAN